MARSKSPFRPRASRSDKQTDIKREAVIETAAKLFWENGYENTSLNLIADELRITKPTLYYYVENKAELLDHCRKRSAAELLEGEEETRRDPSLNSRQRLEIFIRSYARAITSIYGRATLACLHSREARKDLAGLRSGTRGVTQQVQNLLAEGAKDGSIRPCDPHLAAFAILGALNWLPYWYHEGGKNSLDAIVDQFIDAYCNGVAAAAAVVRPRAATRQPVVGRQTSFRRKATH
jgi:AcrR family transcriptional regulator